MREDTINTPLTKSQQKSQASKKEGSASTTTQVQQVAERKEALVFEQADLLERLRRIAACRESLSKENRESFLAITGLELMAEKIVKEANDQISRIEEEKKELIKKTEGQKALDDEYANEQSQKDIRLAVVEKELLELQNKQQPH